MTLTLIGVGVRIIQHIAKARSICIYSPLPRDLDGEAGNTAQMIVMQRDCSGIGTVDAIALGRMLNLTARSVDYLYLTSQQRTGGTIKLAL